MASDSKPLFAISSPAITEKNNKKEEDDDESDEDERGGEKDNRKFIISVTKMIEFSPLGVPLRDVLIPSINFSLKEEYHGVNKKLSYSARLQNGAAIHILVSL